MLSLYIHIPFCKKKCNYCDFLSFPDKEEFFSEYKKALLQEIDRFETPDKIHSIFIGGGTPSYFPWEYLYEIGEKLNQKFSFTNNMEFTIEQNPDTVSQLSLKKYKSMGINRISIGLQAWQNNLLKTLGRLHNRDTFQKAYDLIRNEGFENVNIDLMFSLPGQTTGMWEETLKNVITLSPEHISAYSLIIEEGTPFYTQYNDAPPQSEETDRQMYSFLTDYLKSTGYLQYEISNFSKKGYESKHNKVYWERGNYKGFGLGASSMLNNVRYKNTEDFTLYLKGISVIEEEKLSIENQMEEFMFLGLRLTQGISISKFEKAFNKNIYEVYSKQINKFLSEKLLIKKGDHIALTPKGTDLSNYVFSGFLF